MVKSDMVRVFKGEKCVCMVTDGDVSRVVITKDKDGKDEVRKSQILPADCPYRRGSQNCQEVLTEAEKSSV